MERVLSRHLQQSFYALSMCYLFQLGNHIDIISGKWTAADSGIGAGMDSYFEYLVKGGIMFSKPRLLAMFKGKLI